LATFSQPFQSVNGLLLTDSRLDNIIPNAAIELQETKYENLFCLPESQCNRTSDIVGRAEKFKKISHFFFKLPGINQKKWDIFFKF